VIHLVTGLVSFVAIFGGAVIGLVIAHRLPRHQLTSETQAAVTVSVAVIATLAALVIGLMITAARSSFSARTDEVRELSLQLVRMDRNLRRYGPEAEVVRAKLGEWALTKTRELFPEKGQPRPSSEQTIEMLEGVQDGLLTLNPKDERQGYLRTLCLSLSSTMIQARWSLAQRTAHSIPVPFLVLLIFWLAIVFISFGLFAPPNLTAVVSLFLCAVAVSGGIFLIEELDSPVSGFIHIPSDSMRKALNEVTH